MLNQTTRTNQNSTQAPTPTAIQWLSRLIVTPSISRKEQDAAPLLMEWMQSLGLAPTMVGRNVVARVTRGDATKQGPSSLPSSHPTPSPRLTLCTHFDTVPPAAGYTRDPFAPEVIDGKLYGLGSNDAGAAIASMITAAAALNRRNDWHGTLEVALVVEEEVNGADGAEYLIKTLGLPDAAIIGEPTGLNVCIAQKGLVVMDCSNTGETCHAANAWRLPHKNAILGAVADIPKVYDITFDARDPYLGPTTLHVTVIQGGTVHNSIPDLCGWKIDARVNPAQSLEDVVQAVQARVQATVTPRSLRLRAIATPDTAPVVTAALAARPSSTTFGSDTMSDMVFFRGCDVIKCGPGVTEMSHKPDEYVETRWIEEGSRFYEAAAIEYFARMRK